MQKIPKDIPIVVAIAVALTAGVAVGVHGRFAEKIESTRTELARQRLELDKSRAEARIVPRMAEQVRQLRGRYSDFDRKLPKKRELFGFLRQIGEKMEQVELVSESIEPGDPRQQEYFHTLPIIIRCRGSYARLVRFLAEMTHGERLTRVSRLMTAVEPESGELAIELHMNIYFTER
jgi:Tfp pilus assembly protein PilO